MVFIKGRKDKSTAITHASIVENGQYFFQVMDSAFVFLKLFECVGSSFSISYKKLQVYWQRLLFSLGNVPGDSFVGFFV